MRQRVGGTSARHGGRDQDRGQAGFSLVEMMVAILVLGVVLAALASSLISFSAMSLTNERRVQATAFLTRLHEQLQSVPWEQAAIYDGEQTDLGPLGVDVAATPPTVGGEPLVLLEAPDNSGCPADEPECGRLTFVPRAFDIVEIDDREYELYQAVTWDQDAGDGQAVKRFTTLVRWEVWGQETEQRFESTRAATVADLDASTLPEVLSLLVTPNTIPLDDDGKNESDIEVKITFERGITSASLQYMAVGGSGPELRTVPMSDAAIKDGKPYVFESRIPAGTEEFDVGEQDFVVVGLDGLDTISAVRTVSFAVSSGALPPDVTSATVNRLSVEVDKDGELCETLEVDARVDHLAAVPEAGRVVVNYVVDTGTGSEMGPVGTITGSNDLFRQTFAKGSVSPWQPVTKQGSNPAVDVTDTFDVVATNPDGSASGIVSTPQVTFRAKNGNC